MVKSLIAYAGGGIAAIEIDFENMKKTTGYNRQ